MDPGILDHFERHVPTVARHQNRLRSIVASYLGLSSDLRGSGERPDPFLFLLANSQPLLERKARDRYLKGSVAHRYYLVERQISVPHSIPPAFRPIFYGDRQVRSSSADGIASLRKAARHAKGIQAFEWIRQVVRLVVLFRGGRLNSLYHPHAHGAIFIRIERESDGFHVFEELIHQAGHAFFAILLCADSNLVHSRPEALEAAVDLSDGDRNFLVALHGVITEALTAEALFRVWRLSSDIEKSVIFGRLAFCLSKLGSDLNLLIEFRSLLKRDGLRLLTLMANSYASIVDVLHADLSRADLAGQPYIYDPILFWNKNGWLHDAA